MVVDADESKKMNSNLDHENSATKSLKKRKRASSSSSLMEGLFKYYKEVSDDKINLDLNECGSSNSAIAYLLEETTLSLSKLVDQIYEKMRARESGSASGFSTTVAFVKSTMLFIGHRSLYGVPNADGDILEDETESCLWCWEFCAITVPGFEENRKARLQDLAVLTGGNLITEELGMNLENVDLDMLGSGKKAIISNHDTVVIDGAGDKEALEERCEQHHYVICFIWFNNFNGNNGED